MVWVVLRDGMGGIMRWYGWYYEIAWLVWVVLRDGMCGIMKWNGCGIM